jgi:hypothetical protein
MAGVPYAPDCRTLPAWYCPILYAIESRLVQVSQLFNVILFLNAFVEIAMNGQ